MYRIDSPGSVDEKFVDRDPSEGVPGTVVAAAWLNAVQEELALLIEANGKELDKEDPAQLAKLLTRGLEPGRVPGVDDLPWISVRGFGASPGTADPAQRRQSMQAAIDYGAQKGVRVDIPAGTWVVDAALEYHEGSIITGAGIGNTVIMLSDDADQNSNTMQPSATDGSVQNWMIDALTLDGNHDRPGVSGVGTLEMGGCCLTTWGAQRGIIPRIHARNAVNHCIDVTSGGVLVDGNRVRIEEENKAIDYWPDNMSRWIWFGDVLTENPGDDGLTGHYSEHIYIGRITALEAGGRHPVGHASNGLEIDDGCRHWQVGVADVVRAARGVAIKTHAPEPLPYDIQIGKVTTKRCQVGVYNAAQHYQIGEIIVSDPEQFAGDTSLPDTDAPGIMGVHLRGWPDHNAAFPAIGSIICRATGAESDLQSGLALSGAAEAPLVAPTIGSVQVENWPKNNDSVSNHAGVRVTSNVQGAAFTDIHLLNCGWRGFVDTGGDRTHVGHIHLVGEDIPDSIGVRFSLRPEITGSSVGSVSISGYQTKTSYAQGDNSTRGKSYHQGDFAPTGRLLAGVESSPQYHHLGATDLDTEGQEVLRVGGASVSAWFAERGGDGGFAASSQNAVFNVGYAGSTNRSINTGGTINANGADYAEYREVKPHLYGVVPKGALLGFASDGLLTDRWSEVVGRVLIKSTQPNLVGNDRWGDEQYICERYGVSAVGEPPERNIDDEAGPDVGLLEYEQAVTAWEERRTAFLAALDQERRRWDRVALCGVVPADVAGVGAADVGKYLVPVEGPDDSIMAVAVAGSELSLHQYIASFGVVEGIDEGGGVWVLVKAG